MRGKNSKKSSDIYIWFKVCNQKYKSMIKDLHFHIWLNLPKWSPLFLHILWMIANSAFKENTVLHQAPIHHFSFYALSDSVTSQCLYLLSFLSLSLINSLILFLKLTKPDSLVLYSQNACVNLDLNCFISWDSVF